MILQTRNPSGEAGVLGPAGNRSKVGGGSASILPRTGGAVKTPSTVDLLRRQAAAAALRAEANAAWHRERAARYLAWVDSPWCSQRYAEHAAAADFQERIAARQRALLATLEAVRP